MEKDSKIRNLDEKILIINNDIKDKKARCKEDIKKLEEKKKPLQIEKRKLKAKK